jgi:hypothetical protein
MISVKIRFSKFNGFLFKLKLRNTRFMNGAGVSVVGWGTMLQAESHQFESRMRRIFFSQFT